LGDRPNAVHLRKISVRPELVEGFWVRGWWFDTSPRTDKVNSIAVLVLQYWGQTTVSRGLKSLASNNYPSVSAK